MTDNAQIIVDKVCLGDAPRVWDPWQRGVGCVSVSVKRLSTVQTRWNRSNCYPDMNLTRQSGIVGGCGDSGLQWGWVGIYLPPSSSLLCIRHPTPSSLSLLTHPLFSSPSIFTHNVKTWMFRLGVGWYRADNNYILTSLPLAPMLGNFILFDYSRDSPLVSCLTVFGSYFISVLCSCNSCYVILNWII